MVVRLRAHGDGMAAGTKLPVLWANEKETEKRLAELQGKRIRLEFELKDASLFAFEFLGSGDAASVRAAGAQEIEASAGDAG